MKIPKKSCFYWLTFILLIAGGSQFLRGDETSPPETIEDTSVSIIDIKGTEHTPFKFQKAKAAVLLFVTQDCPISNAYSPELARLYKDFESKGFDLMLVYVDPDVTKDEIQKHVKEYGLSDFTAVWDKSHDLVRATGATVTPEAVVVLPDGVISYRGRIDNMYPTLGQRRRVITEKDLRNVLGSIIENKTIPVARTNAVGCYIPNLAFD
ncbi:MAG: redoxin domain-containing protein [Verrucomicrobia bacterium]|nr:redoxin domain-containing protein [Verrucomicrobiota bacterium]MDA1068668.1 redoxin domain-containing protein [Verrucomicrobiota bacterium]